MSGRQRSLYPAERRYMLDAARGLTAQQSARQHSVSVNTVNTTLKRAKLALGASNIAHAVALSFLYGEITKGDVARITTRSSTDTKEQQS
ncbi:helix-turn-helix DNA binding domain protein [Streptomyces phage Mischief19]|nr:helix-turn-helix DNA binding domain protein [Streptomyces phage Mischief19]